MQAFHSLGLCEPLLRAITAEGYSAPTPIQSKVIPAALTGRDIVGIAQTGTGKTAAFVLPLLHRISKDKQKPRPNTCRVLIVAPTRELAAQITESVRAYSAFLRITSTLVVGGVNAKPQLRGLARGPDVVVATPGRLLDHISAGALKLDNTRAIVLDEADHMLDMGFIPDIRRIMKSLPRKRQTLLLSATMPKQIRQLAADFLQDPAELTAGPAAKPIERIDQRVMHVEPGTKRSTLTGLLKDIGQEQTIIFTRTKRGADKISLHLQKSEVSAGAIHGNKSQNQRNRVLNAFRSGSVNVLVATDIAARGIDIDGVSHVINFELPNVPEAYVHRIGRTARAGKCGVAISLCDASERPFLRDIERLIGKQIPATGEHGDDWLQDDRPDRKQSSKKASGNKTKRKSKAQRGRPGGKKPAPANRRKKAHTTPNGHNENSGLMQMLST